MGSWVPYVEKLVGGFTCSSRKELDGEDAGASIASTVPPKPSTVAVAVSAGLEASLDAARIPPYATFRACQKKRHLTEIAGEKVENISDLKVFGDIICIFFTRGGRLRLPPGRQDSIPNINGSSSRPTGCIFAVPTLTVGYTHAWRSHGRRVKDLHARASSSGHRAHLEAHDLCFFSPFALMNSATIAVAMVVVDYDGTRSKSNAAVHRETAGAHGNPSAGHAQSAGFDGQTSGFHGRSTGSLVFGVGDDP